MDRTSSLKVTGHLVGAVVLSFGLGLVVGGIVPFQVSGWGWLVVIFLAAVLVLDVVTLLRAFWSRKV
jgi:hypothetical protein